MSIGFAVFAIAAVLGTACAGISCFRTAGIRGNGPALREAAVLLPSLFAYAAVCLWLGYSIGAQCLALLASAVPLWLGRKFVPPFSVRTEGDRS